MKGFNRYKNKFNAKPANGFGSKLESAVHDHLVFRESVGEISDIKRQQTVVLQDGARDVRITWRVDFSFFEKRSMKVVYCEAKGIETQEYKLKLKMWRANPPATLEIWKGSYQNPRMVERIEKKT